LPPAPPAPLPVTPPPPPPPPQVDNALNGRMDVVLAQKVFVCSPSPCVCVRWQGRGVAILVRDRGVAHSVCLRVWTCMEI